MWLETAKKINENNRTKICDILMLTASFNQELFDRTLFILRESL
jgi:hypothetical protein